MALALVVLKVNQRDPNKWMSRARRIAVLRAPVMVAGETEVAPNPGASQAGRK